MKRSLLNLLLLLLPLGASAAETAAFLKLGLGARAIGMGGAFTAVADDINALGWNPAGLSALEKRELGAMHAELASETRYDFMGYAQPLKQGTLAVGGVYLSHGSIEGRSAAGAPTGSFNASDQAVSLGYGSRLGSELGWGAAVKYVRSAVADESAQGFAVDLGARYVMAAPLGPGTPLFGLALLNAGPGLKLGGVSSQLPLTASAGLGYKLPKGLTLALDVKHRPHGDGTGVCAGAEYALLENFRLRAGYGSLKAENGSVSGGLAAINGLAFGVGFKLKDYSLDYSFTPMGELGNVQRFSLGARF